VRYLLANALVWAAVAAAAATVIDAAAGRGAIDAVAATPEAAPSGLRVETVSAARPPREAFAAIAARPLFTPGRRPAAAPAPAGGAERFPAALIGVVGAPDGRIALVRDADGAVARLREGGAVAGWRVERIEDARIVLSGAGGERALRLDDAAEAPAPRRAGDGAAADRGSDRPPARPRGDLGLAIGVHESEYD
jgi:hypothetical protein